MKSWVLIHMRWKVGSVPICLYVIGMAGEGVGLFLEVHMHIREVFRKCHVWDGNTALSALLSSLSWDEGGEDAFE